MKTKLLQFGCTAYVLLTLAVTGHQRAQAQPGPYNTFTYQGRLTDDFGPGWDDNPHTWDFRFKAVIPPFPCYDPDCLWPTNCPNCSTIELGTNSVIVNQGLFTTPITMPTGLLSAPFGVLLQIAVRTNGGGEFTTLSPMQRLTATPYATIAQSVSGPVPASSLTGPLGSAQLGGSYSNALSFLNPGNLFAGDGSLLANVNAATIGGLNPCNLPCYWKTNGNAGTVPNYSFLGTTDLQPLELKVNSARAQRYQPPTDLSVNTPDLIGGNASNAVFQSGGSVIGGGGTATEPNTIRGVINVIGGGKGNNLDLARWSVLGGGVGNQMRGFPTNSTEYSFIGGGQSNTLVGDWSFLGGGGYNRIEVPLNEFNAAATLGGGSFNLITRKGGTLAGGGNNKVVGLWASVGGGFQNEANGSFATVPGGTNNIASGFASLAAGQRARAAHDGTFVWGDSQHADFASTSTNQYLIRAAGGVGIGTTTPAMQLHVQGDTRVTGVFRSGSETGTAQLPGPAGLVVRRINSTSAALNQVVARNDYVTLERDGSNGGMIIRYPAGTYHQAIACTAMTSSGTLINYYNTLVNPGAASTLSLMSGATNVVQFHCTFGDTYNQGHHTEVNLIREGTDFYWAGTLNSTYNQ